MQALLSGSSGIVSAATRGAPIIAIASQMNRPPATLYVQPKITQAAQLKGQTPRHQPTELFYPRIDDAGDA